MPNGPRSAGSPIPESCKIWGVPIVPADRMTSFVAWIVILGARIAFDINQEEYVGI